MTTYAGIRCIIVVAIVTGSTVVCYSSMSPFQYIEVIMTREGRRTPVRVRRMTGRTVRRQAQAIVIRIRRLVEVCRMAGGTIRWRTFKAR